MELTDVVGVFCAAEECIKDPILQMRQHKLKMRKTVVKPWFQLRGVSTAFEIMIPRRFRYACV